jgi:hypothetical protein
MSNQTILKMSAGYLRCSVPYAALVAESSSNSTFLLGNQLVLQEKAVSWRKHGSDDKAFENCDKLQFVQ